MEGEASEGGPDSGGPLRQSAWRRRRREKNRSERELERDGLAQVWAGAGVASCFGNICVLACHRKSISCEAICKSSFLC